MFPQDDSGERVCGASACPVGVIAAAAAAAAAAAVSGDANADDDWIPRLGERIESMCHDSYINSFIFSISL